VLGIAEEESAGLVGRSARGEKVTGTLRTAESTGESDGERRVGFPACRGFRPVNLPKMVKRTRGREVETLGTAGDARDGR